MTASGTSSLPIGCMESSLCVVIVLCLTEPGIAQRESQPAQSHSASCWWTDAGGHLVSKVKRDNFLISVYSNLKHTKTGETICNATMSRTSWIEPWRVQMTRYLLSFVHVVKCFTDLYSIRSWTFAHATWQTSGTAHEFDTTSTARAEGAKLLQVFICGLSFNPWHCFLRNVQELEQLQLEKDPTRVRVVYICNVYEYRSRNHSCSDSLQVCTDRLMAEQSRAFCVRRDHYDHWNHLRCSSGEAGKSCQFGFEKEWSAVLGIRNPSCYVTTVNVTNTTNIVFLFSFVMPWFFVEMSFELFRAQERRSQKQSLQDGYQEDLCADVRKCPKRSWSFSLRFPDSGVTALVNLSLVYPIQEDSVRFMNCCCAVSLLARCRIIGHAFPSGWGFHVSPSQLRYTSV